MSGQKSKLKARVLAVAPGDQCADIVGLPLLQTQVSVPAHDLPLAVLGMLSAPPHVVGNPATGRLSRLRRLLLGLVGQTALPSQETQVT